eukprot:TRINITY_DN14959_c0_g1_i1.p1 TRINITY_DN14959_c0_g1~~TRINITY_DN14959_c0_g1_i1.p1  ORF type:complete len:600 (+),score=133.85 TRINITY_DN14959_c0_g1_i1:195-1802(+)
MDQEARELIKSRESLENGKRKLTSSTKEWVQLPDSQKLDAIKGENGLLKMYQEHINSVTSHSSTIESAFLSLYKLLASVQAPTQAFALVLREKGLCKNLADVENEIADLQQTIKRHKEELTELTNQEVTILELKQTITDLKEDFEIELAAALQKGREEGTRENTQLFEELRQRETAITTELSRAGDERNKQAELSAKIQCDMALTQEKMEQLVSATEYNEEWLRQENDCLQGQIAVLKEELSSLQKSFDDRVSTQLLEQVEKSSVLEEHISRLDTANKALTEEKATLEETIATLNKNNTTQAKAMSVLNEQAESLREKVRTSLGSGGIKKTDRVAEKELVTLKEENTDLTATIVKLQHDLDQSNKLVTRLETDLSTVTAEGVSQLTITDDSNGDKQALAVVSGQRDRYKKLLFEMETDNTRLKKKYHESITSSKETHRQLVQENQTLLDKLKVHRPDNVSINVPMTATTAQHRSMVSVVDSLYRFVNSTSSTRVAFFLYLCFLHLVVFFLVSRVNRDTHSRSALRYPHHHGTAAF